MNLPNSGLCCSAPPQGKTERREDWKNYGKCKCLSYQLQLALSFLWSCSLFHWYIPYNAECQERRYQVKCLASFAWIDLLPSDSQKKMNLPNSGLCCSAPLQGKTERRDDWKNYGKWKYLSYQLQLALSFLWSCSLFHWYIPYNAECQERRYQVKCLASFAWIDLLPSDSQKKMNLPNSGLCCSAPPQGKTERREDWKNYGKWKYLSYQLQLALSFLWSCSLFHWYIPYNAECQERRYQVKCLASFAWIDLLLNHGLLEHGRILSLYPGGLVIITIIKKNVKLINKKKKEKKRNCKIVDCPGGPQNKSEGKGKEW